MRILIHSRVLYQVRAGNIYIYIYVHNEISVFLSLHLTHLMYSQSHYTPVSAVKKLQYHSLKMHNVILALKSKSSGIITHFACKYK